MSARGDKRPVAADLGGTVWVNFFGLIVHNSGCFVGRSRSTLRDGTGEPSHGPRRGRKDVRVSINEG